MSTKPKTDFSAAVVSSDGERRTVFELRRRIPFFDLQEYQIWPCRQIEEIDKKLFSSQSVSQSVSWLISFSADPYVIVLLTS